MRTCAYSYVPSEKPPIASLEGESARYLSVTLGSPSRIIRWTMMSALNTIVQVESRNLFCIALKISATPASPACVATSMCSTYLALGAANLIFVPPFTDFSKEPDMANLILDRVRGMFGDEDFGCQAGGYFDCLTATHSLMFTGWLSEARVLFHCSVTICLTLRSMKP